MACGTIAANITASCSAPVVAGNGSTLYLANFDDWQQATKVYETNTLLVQSITLDTNKYLYKVEMPGSNNLKSMCDLVVSDVGITNYKHTVSFLIPQVDGATLEKVQALTKGKFVAFVVNNNDIIEIYGAKTGLQCVAGTIKDAYANSGMFLLSLASNDATLESNIMLQFYGSTGAFDVALSELQSLVLA